MIRSPCSILSVIIFFVLAVTGCAKNEDDGVSSLQKDSAADSAADSTTFKHSASNITYKKIEWPDLLPDDDLKVLENPPEYFENIEDGSEADQLSSQLKATPANISESTPLTDTQKRYQQALVSKNIRPEFNGQHVRIPGFIVPLEFYGQTITTFFLVPFFGACLHYPPPPPNQIIYGEYEPGIRLENLYDPFWINGKLSTTLIENDMATAAYTIDVANIEPYEELNDPQNIKPDPF